MTRPLRTLVLIAVLAVVLMALLAGLWARPPAPLTVQLLAFNDLHGHLEPPNGENGRVGSTPAGGAAYLAAHIARAAAANPRTLIVAAGDLVGASPLASGLFHDEPVIEILNAMNVSVASVGNHEFDEGIDELLRLVRGGCHPADGCQDGDGFGGARFQYLAANVVRTRSGALLLPATTIRPVGGVHLGFIGLTYAGTRQIVPPHVNREVTFLDEATVVNRHAASLKRRGAHAVVLLIHQGGRQSPGGGDPDGCHELGGPIVPLVRQLTPDVDVVISGHSHAFYNCRIDGRLVTSAGSFGRGLTRIELAVDPSGGQPLRTGAVNHVVTRDLPPDPRVAAIVRRYTGLVEKQASAVVGSVSADLPRGPNPWSPSPLGTLIADAQLEAAREAGDRDAAVAFMNGGGIRAAIVAVTKPGPAPVTYRDLYNVQPFGNAVMAVTMSGEMLGRLLEQQFDSPVPGQRRMLHPSTGFTYRYDAAAPAGRRVDRTSLRLDGRAIDPAETVRVVASDYLVGGGDGMTVFGESTDRVSISSDIDALVSYFRRHSPVAPRAAEIAATAAAGASMPAGQR